MSYQPQPPTTSRPYALWAVLLACGLLVQPAAAAVFTVNSATDAVDLSPGDGVCAISTSAQTVRDEFTALSYAGNNGSQNWTGPWSEAGEADGPGSGRMQVVSSGQCAAGNCFRIGGDGVSIDGRMLTREANLAGAIAATLSLSYRRQELDGSGGSVVLEVSGNGGSSWSPLTTISLNGSDGGQVPLSYDISGFIAANTQIRVRGVGSTESYLFADNIQIAYTLAGPCTLRAAVQEANALGGADTINVPPGTYALSIAGTGEDNADTGDLDVTDSVTITGTGSAATFVDGGALDRVFEIYSPNATISGLTVQNGSFSGEGGGIRVSGGNSLVMQNAAVVNNAAPDKSGGGIKVSSGSLTLINVTVSGNSAKDSPGIFNQSASLTLTNVTIANNSGTGKGAFNPGSGSLTIVNTIVANSVGVPDCDSDSGPSASSLDSDGSCNFGTTANPLLGPLQNNGGPTLTHALLAGSPAIDAGTNTGCPATDQRGVARPVDGDGDTTATCDIGAYEAASPGVVISGTVFEDADFAGSAAAYDGGVADLALPAVDVELYTSADAFVATVSTNGAGQYQFSGVPDGSYKVRARSATVGDTDTPAAGGFNACVAGLTCAAPLPEMTWGNGVATYGGQSAGADDTATGDDAGPGDTWVPVTVSGASVTGVDLGFAYNLIVNTLDDANPVTARSAQGSYRQFLKNANAIGGAGGTTASASEFRMQVPANRSDGGDSWWRITAAAALPAILDASTTVDGSTQAANSGADSNGRGPEIELFGNGVVSSGIEVSGVAGTGIRDMAVNSFQGHGIYIHGAGVAATSVYGSYLGTDAIGENALPNLDFGIWVNDNAAGVDIGGALPGQGNLISGNGGTVAESGISVGLLSGNVTIRGNLVGTDRTGTQPLGNAGPGIGLSGADGVIIGGAGPGEGNVLSANGSDGVRITNFVRNVTIQGNRIGVGSGGAETTLGNGGSGVFTSSNYSPSTIAVGGLQSGEGNLVAYNQRGVMSQGSGTGDTILGNILRDNLAQGIETATDGVLLAGNLVWRNTLSGIRLRNDAGTSASNNKVYHNTVHGNSSDGLRVEGAGVIARNNVVTGNAGFGINVSGGTVTEGTNDITDAATAPANGAGRSNAALDASDINLDPLYVNPGAGDFALTSCTSPAIDTGQNLAADQPDMNGAAAGLFNGTLPDMGAFETACAGPAVADLSLAVTDAPDPAPLNGPLIYSLLVTNNGTGTASNVTVTDTLPASVNFVSASSSQGSCSGGAVVSCNLGAILNGGTASVEIQVLTTATGTITNNASVTADQADPVPGNNADSDDTTVTTGSSFDVPLTQFQRLAGFLDYSVTGASLRTGPNSGDPCAVGATAAATLAGIPATATVRGAWLYWAGSGATTDANVTLDGAPIAAGRTFESDFVLAPNTYEFFGGFADVTAQVAGKGNGVYTFGGLSVDTTGIYCSSRAVIAGWSLLVVFEDASLTGKTLVVYDGFDLTRNGSTAYLLSGIYSSGPPEARTTALLWDGDEDLGGASEQLLFNGTPLSDGLNPVNNVYNSTINSLGSATSYGMDLDSFDVSGQVSVGDTLATLQVDTGPDLVILNNVVLQVKTNVIAGTVFEDVNYGGGPGRDLAAATAAAPSFSVGRPGAVVELYDAAGVFLRVVTTDASGNYGFSGLPDGTYQVRVVNDTVQSARAGGGSGELAVQTFRTNASGVSLAAVTGEVGGADPAAQDDPANATSANLATLTAQSVAPATITAAVTRTSVDFGYNFDTIVNTSNAGQGSLAQFIANANALDNASLAQAGLSAGIEHSLFMIPSTADPLGRAADPGFDAGRGVARIGITTLLPSVATTDTAIDGSTQTTLIGDTNLTLLGTGGTTGTGPDDVPGTADELSLAQVAGPEIEIVDDGGLAVGLDLQASDLTVRGIAIYGFGNDPASPAEANIRLGSGSNETGHLIELNVVGTSADSFADPGAASRSGSSGVLVLGPDGGTLRNNLIGYAQGSGFSARQGAAGWTIQGNEVRGNSTFGYGVGDGIALEGAGSGGATITGNLIAANGAVGIETFNAAGGFVIADNTITGNGAGTGVGASETSGIRLYGTGSSCTNNIVAGNYGAGVLIANGATGNLVSRNSIDGNGAITGQIGIDLQGPGDDAGTGTAPFVSANDGGDGDGGGNNRQNYPDLAAAVTAGASLNVSGTLSSAVSTAYTLEFYSSPAAHASGFGEGASFLGSDTVATDGTGAVGFTTALPVSVPVGTVITATATSPGNDTSEFSNTVITATNLKIEKRAFHVDGTPIASGSTMPEGVPFYYLLYINNRDGPRTDVSLQDVLDPVFGYQPGSLRVDNSVAACAAAACTAGEESSVFAATVAAGSLTDAVDGDVASYTAGSRTVDVGDQNIGNAQLDIAGNRVLALLFSVRLQ